MPGLPQTVTTPSLSVTTNWPTWIRLNRPKTVVRERLTKGPQVKEPKYVRSESKGRVRTAIGEGHDLLAGWGGHK